MVTIGMIVFNDVQLLDIAGPLDLFRATDGITPWLIAKTSDPVRAWNLPQVTFTPDYAMEHAPEFDVLFVPGGVGVGAAIEDDETRHFIQHRGERAKYVTSVCTGSLVLGTAGLLHGYRASTHWRYMDLLRDVGAIPTDERVVTDRNRLTAGGVTSGMDFGLSLIAELANKEAAERTQLWLQYAPMPPFDAGHPSTAPAEMVQRLKEETETVFEQRRQLILTAIDA